MPLIRDIVTRTIASHKEDALRDVFANWKTWVLVNPALTLPFAAPVKGVRSLVSVTGLVPSHSMSACCAPYTPLAGHLTTSASALTLSVRFVDHPGLSLRVVIKAFTLKRMRTTSLVCTVEVRYPWHKALRARAMHKEWLAGCMDLPTVLQKRKPQVGVDGSVTFARERPSSRRYTRL